MRILIVDDEQNILKTTSMALTTMGHQVETAFSSKQALQQLQSERFDVLFLDLHLGKENGLDLMDTIRVEQPNLPVIVFTAYSSVESAVHAMQKGAFDYIQKPFVPEQIRQILAKIKDNRSLKTRVETLESQVESDTPSTTLQSESAEMQRVYELAGKAAKSEASILLMGPSGTGKTVLARKIHAASSRSKEAFVTVHCPSLSKNLLESELFGHVKGAFTGAVSETWGKVAKANEGTLFLDEIGELPLDIQAKLLRLLQDRQYERVGETRTRSANLRIITATNRDLAQEVEEGIFREDLFYRLNVISLELVPLAKRREDILPISRGYLDFYGERMGKVGVRMSAEVEQAFMAYPWPGNLRELRNVIERALIFCERNEIREVDLPEGFKQPENNGVHPGQLMTIEALEAEHIKRILQVSKNLEHAAQTLGIDTATLYRKRKRLGLLTDKSELADDKVRC